MASNFIFIVLDGRKELFAKFCGARISMLNSVLESNCPTVSVEHAMYNHQQLLESCSI